MHLSALTALTPLDGRYARKSLSLRKHFSEYALIRQRLCVEIAWLKLLSTEPLFTELAKLSPQAFHAMDALLANFSEAEAGEIKEIESRINHDVKAVEVWLRERLTALNWPADALQYIHFACTSEDINNIAHALMLKGALEEVMFPALEAILIKLKSLSNNWANIAMLARTHGQPASPTTVGKEFANFFVRLQASTDSLAALRLRGKFNGAVGNYNAHMIAYPEVNWPRLAQRFVESFGLDFNAYTAQIEPHDYMAALFDNIARINTILLDLNRDMWGYIALGYFTQKLNEEEVGSSTMPHKVNPIDFENAEGNLGLANALFRHFSEKLPVSRWQRDLSDSTVLRNMGAAFAYSLLAYQSCLQGLNKIQVNEPCLSEDLANNWEVLAEPIQTIMRRYGLADAYEQLKKLTRGKEGINQNSLRDFIAKLAIPETEKQRLYALTPGLYTGIAAQLANLEKKE